MYSEASRADRGISKTFRSDRAPRGCGLYTVQYVKAKYLDREKGKGIVHMYMFIDERN